MNDRFCDRCGIDLGLHSLIDENDEPTPQDCEHAEAKVRIMEQFFRPFVGS